LEIAGFDVVRNQSKLRTTHYWSITMSNYLSSFDPTQAELLGEGGEAQINVAAAISALDAAPAFIHLDYFAGNVMFDQNQLSAVIDFGYSSIIGDRRMNALVAAAYLVTPRITPTVSADDQAIAFAWLRERDLFTYYERGLPWLAAYWTFASDDIELYAWCSSILTHIENSPPTRATRNS
jgi:aminoglycoside phosphotransferase (APT) family kinase protein